jgi:outer membrane protein assembly factor BamB
VAVTGTGSLVGIANGSATITASVGNISAATQVTVFQPSPTTTDWTTFQGNAAHTAFADITLYPARFTPLWTWSVQTPINSVATGAGKVFVTQDIFNLPALLYALNEADGTMSWQFGLGQMLSVGPPAHGNGSVLVSSVDAAQTCTIWATDATLGTQILPEPCQMSMN